MKEVVYDGLVKLVLVDPSSGGHVLDFLMPHFLRFFRQVTVSFILATLTMSLQSGLTKQEKSCYIYIF